MNNADRNRLWQKYDAIDKRMHEFQELIAGIQKVIKSHPPDMDYLIQSLKGYKMILDGLRLQRDGIQKIIEG